MVPGCSCSHLGLTTDTHPHMLLSKDFLGYFLHEANSRTRTLRTLTKLTPKLTQHTLRTLKLHTDKLLACRSRKEVVHHEHEEVVDERVGVSRGMQE